MLLSNSFIVSSYVWNCDPNFTITIFSNDWLNKQLGFYWILDRCITLDLQEVYSGSQRLFKMIVPNFWMMKNSLPKDIIFDENLVFCLKSVLWILQGVDRSQPEVLPAERFRFRKIWPSESWRTEVLLKERPTTDLFRSKDEDQVSNEQREAGCLGKIGGWIMLPSFCGDDFVKHYKDQH